VNKTWAELGLRVDLSYMEDLYQNVSSTNELWDIFCKAMRGFGIDSHVAFTFSLGPERRVQIKDQAKYKWMRGSSINHVHGGSYGTKLMEKILSDDYLEKDIFGYHANNSDEVALLSADFLSPDMPNYEHSKKFWKNFAVDGFRSSFIMPYSGQNPAVRHAFGLHTTLSGPGLEKLLKKVWKELLLHCHRFIQSFHVIFPQELAKDLGLTKKQFTTLQWFNFGFSNAEIADKMGITPSAVSLHLKEIKRKLGVETNREITSYARKLGIVE
jgi:DNA-binding CsgD family transcriptional regulator